MKKMRNKKYAPYKHYLVKHEGKQLINFLKNVNNHPCNLLKKFYT